MFHEVNRDSLSECSIEVPSTSACKNDLAIENEMLLARNNEIVSFNSPIIPQILPYGNGPTFKSQYESVNLAFHQLDAVEDRENKLYWLCDYSYEIFQNLRENEMNRQLVCFASRQVEFRPMLLNLLREVVKVHNLSRTTLHLAVYYLDCFLDKYKIPCDTLKLIALTCLLIAAKIEETEINVPKFDTLNKLVDGAYLLTHLKQVEVKVLTSFNFDMIRPTAATFAEYFEKRIITRLDYNVYVNNYNNKMALKPYQDYNQHEQQLQQHQEHEWESPNQDLCVYNHALSILHPQSYEPCPYNSFEEMLDLLSHTYFSYIDVSLNYLKFANTRPSIIASACIAAVRKQVGIIPMWTSHLEKLTDCTVDIIMPYMEAIINIYSLHSHNELLQQLETTFATTASTSTNTSILLDSPDSGIVLDNTIFDFDADNCDPGNNTNFESATDEEDEPYVSLEYPLLSKRRRLA